MRLRRSWELPLEEHFLTDAVRTLVTQDHQERCATTRARHVSRVGISALPFLLSFFAFVPLVHTPWATPLLSFLSLVLVFFSQYTLRRIKHETQFLTSPLERFPGLHYHSPHFFSHLRRLVRDLAPSLTPADIPPSLHPLLSSSLDSLLTPREREAFDVLFADSPTLPLADLLFAARTL